VWKKNLRKKNNLTTIINMSGIEVALALLLFIVILVVLIFLFRDKIEIRVGEFRYGVFGTDSPTQAPTGTPTTTSATPTPTGTTESFLVFTNSQYFI
jgi:hypothetical protein